ncbi:MAG: phosphoribosyl-ATP diphosphatase [Proteobacteria bacterium]|nr:phosphoribosyl-ATP diphosphatase [Pseudomonadota bacterium]
MGVFDQLEALQQDITAKAGASPEASYTAQLLAKGVEKCAKKFGEEAVELALAAVQGKRDEATKEAADVLYHLLVLLQAAGVAPDDVMAELRRRAGTSGLAEKAARRT